MLVMSRGEDIGGPEALGAQIGHEVASLEGLLHALDRVAGPVPAVAAQPDPSPSADEPGLPGASLPDASLPGPTATGSGIDPRKDKAWLQ
jgi:hypothetical protein